MVVDTSAVVVILFREREREQFKELLLAQAELAMSVVSFYEASIVSAAKKQHGDGAALVDDFVSDFGVEVVPLDRDSAVAARLAYFRFGRGYHSAALNLADCFSYSLARARDVPLLFKGDDFAKTDVVPAWRP